jgi:diguanylate cyclase (GGDEF)-like protein/PAS domain S-box-containing protein
VNRIDSHLEQAFHDAGQGLLVINSKGQRVYANNTAARMAGFGSLEEYMQSQEHFKGTDVVDELGLPIPIDELPYQKVLTDCQSHSQILRIHCAGSQDGKSLLVHATPIFDSSGNIEFALSTMIDVTERLQEEGELQQKARRAEMLLQFSQTVAEAGLEYPEIITTIAKSIHQLAGDICIVHIRATSEQLLNPVAAYEANPAVDELVSSITELIKQNPVITFSDVSEIEQSIITPGSTGSALEAGEPPLIDSLFDKYQISSALTLPLRLHSQVFGSILLFRMKPEPTYVGNDLQVYQDFADRAALAIENARLYAVEHQRARELNALHKATLALLTSIDLDVLLGQILDAAMTAIPAAEKGELHLIAKDTGKLEMRAALGYHDPRIKSLSTSKIQWHTARAIHMRQSLLIQDASIRPNDLASEAIPEVEDIKSIVIAPLILNEDVLGALTLSSNKISAFSESDRNLLVSFAATTTEALHNAQLHSEVQKLAITDPLTSLYNRRGFLEIGRREIQRARRFKHPLSAIMLDIDHFKEVNDTYGHGVGDRVLVSLAVSLQNNIRSVDILGRYGGDEFVLLLPETDLFTASAVAERLRQAAADMRVVTERGDVAITVSLGISKAVADTQDLSSLLENVDTALYFAKQHGRNRIEIN